MKATERNREEIGAVPCSLLALRRLCGDELRIALERAGRERKRAKELSEHW